MPRGGKGGKKSLSSRKRPRVDVDTEENYEDESLTQIVTKIEVSSYTELRPGSETPVILPPDATPVPAFLFKQVSKLEDTFF